MRRPARITPETGNETPFNRLLFMSFLRHLSGNGARNVAIIRLENEGYTMLKTIMIGHYMSIQGQFVRTTPTGLMVVRIGEQTYAGRPIKQSAA
jgi:hypothetical protein